MSKCVRWLFLPVLIGSLVNCAVPSGTGTPVRPQQLPLSLKDPLFKTCIFSPQARIVHFPMYHFPPTGEFDSALKEKVTKSQFQLMHSILAYFPHIAVFDEHLTTSEYNQDLFELLESGRAGKSSYTRADGEEFNLQKQFYEARRQFRTGVPQYYEHLTPRQKNYLFHVGASMTLYFLKHVLQLHRVINPSDFQVVIDEIDRHGGIKKYFQTHSSPDDYYIYKFREGKLKLQVLEFFRINSWFPGLALVAFGALHKFNDDFKGFFFESGKSAGCLAWDRS